MTPTASALCGRSGERVALCDVTIEAVLRDLLAEVTATQTYRNDEAFGIEAVYTFPLPLDAVLLDLEVEIGERRLKGVVVERRAAETAYENAMEAGDTAVMLEAIEPGLYTLNLGNLLPGECARIRLRYALLHRWTGDTLRLLLPTTVAPRYGRSLHQPHQTPEASLTAENRFSVRIDVFGALREARIHCPTHALQWQLMADKAVMTLQQTQAVMDRDLVLQVQAPKATRSFVLSGRDGAGTTAIASFQPFFPGLRQPEPLALVIVVDCSGSMGGDAISQARQALSDILASLTPQDRVALVAFGNATRVMEGDLLAATAPNLARAQRFVSGLQADMGGTEIAGALHRAQGLLADDHRGDIFLITDGAVSNPEPIIANAVSAGHRIFTVGVGSSVSEAFVRRLASRTRGECELVSPREGMAQRVLRHFERMRAPRAEAVTVRWPEGAHQQHPARIDAVFEGDTLIACASFAQAPTAGEVVLEMITQAGETLRVALPMPWTQVDEGADSRSTVARVAAAMRLESAADPEGLRTALDYQLASRWTNWLAVMSRADDEKSAELPVLRKVPQTLAAGAGGIGTVFASMPDVPIDILPSPVPLSRLLRASFRTNASIDALANAGTEPREAHAGLGRREALYQLLRTRASELKGMSAQAWLVESGLYDDFKDLLKQAEPDGLDPEGIATLVLAGLLEDLVGLLPADARVAAAAFQRYAAAVRQTLGLRAHRQEALNALLTQLEHAVQRLRRHPRG